MTEQEVVQRIAELTEQAHASLKEAAELARQHNCPFEFKLRDDHDGYPVGGKFNLTESLPDIWSYWECGEIDYDDFKHFYDDAGNFDKEGAIEEYGEDLIEHYLNTKDKRDWVWSRWKASSEVSQC